MNQSPDILVFLSDQHHAKYAGYVGHDTVRTPHMDQLAEEGTVFEAAYTSCPLCVPSRISMLTGQLPEKTGVYDNNGALGGDQATFLHGIAAAGYETVLCGRMHFLGDDQRHGFTRRIMGEMTPLYWGRYGPHRKDLGPYVGTMANQSLKIVGGGTSPVLEYDKAVIRAALEYLQQEHHKPQCIVVGTYGPHHSFVAPPELYQHYKPVAGVPDSFYRENGHPALQELHEQFQALNEENLIKVRAAYLGMIETIDGQLGEVRSAWREYLKRSGRPGVFVYMSDHGEQAGEQRLLGKSTFYEGSAAIPMMISGHGVIAGRRVSQPVSIMDLGPTLCEFAGADTPPRPDGISLKPLIAGGPESDRYVISECMANVDGKPVPGRMLRWRQWKYVSYAALDSHDMLFDLSADPCELNNLAADRTDIAQSLRDTLYQSWNIPAIVEKHTAKVEHHRLLSKWGYIVDVAEPERWPVPKEATALPVVE
ncbi:sulfatase-like hydrolase/transferase [Paenibacillus sp. GD4]|uniref:sulfatase-like hydrolase/transferase n=1 Tax=Paenibacillus sp. GD4 TaxID=3068890 RepID=UPI00279684C5|nr:sulfatase-like hydrolase/transferase [Paenibacillus sp. GD4]MDQ1913834.1 sulfatase-like hydrolase/transferase [Paenibacillus sp. GD4]